MLVAAGIVSALVLTSHRQAARPPAPSASAAASVSAPVVAPASAAAVERALFARLGRLPGTETFVDAATGLARTNTAVHCSALPRRSRAFTCVVSSASGVARVFDARVVNGVFRINLRH